MYENNILVSLEGQLIHFHVLPVVFVNTVIIIIAIILFYFSLVHLGRKRGFDAISTDCTVSFFSEKNKTIWEPAHHNIAPQLHSQPSQGYL